MTRGTIKKDGRTLKNEAVRRNKGRDAFTSVAPSPTEPTTKAVYILGNAEETRIKIGHSENFKKRIAQHQAGAKQHNSSWTVLAIVNGTRGSEKRLQNSFAAQRAKGHTEHFDVNARSPESDPLLRYVRWLRDQSYVAVDEKAAEVQKVSDGEWLPCEGREKTFDQTRLPFDGPWSFLPVREITPEDYYTPPEIMEPVRGALGAIDLDPASSAYANTYVRATQFFSRADDGLSNRWYGRVWLNPPFSEWPGFAQKLLEELRNVKALCCLAGTGTITAEYFKPVLERSQVMVIVTGRRAFKGPVADEGCGSPPSGHVVLYFGDDVEKFEEGLSQIGVLYRTVKK